MAGQAQEAGTSRHCAILNRPRLVACGCRCCFRRRVQLNCSVP